MSAVGDLPTGERLPAAIGLGATLRALRDVRRVSQSRLARRAGFDHSYLSRLESGARTPTRDCVDKLAGALELDRTDHDALLVAAGYLPIDTGHLLADEPEVAAVLALLRDDSVAETYRDMVRGVLRSLSAVPLLEVAS